MIRGLILALLLSAPPTLRIEIRPHVLLVGEKLTITCYVPRAPERRWLEMGIRMGADDIPLRTFQLDGQSSPIWLAEYLHVTCDDTLAYCAVGTDRYPSSRAIAPFTVGGCDGR